MNVIQQIEQEHAQELLAKRPVPEFQPGDTVRVNVKVVEGSRSRIQAYEGVVIARDGGGIHESFTVRKISYGEGVERVFPVFSPLIDSIQVVRRGKVRRAKLYYLRGRRGKSARIPERVDKARQAALAAVKQAKEKGPLFKKPKGNPDPLTKITGISEDLQGLLKKMGVIQFTQVAELTDDQIALIDDTLKLNDAIVKDDWVGQAQALIAEETAGEAVEAAAKEEAEAAAASEGGEEEKQD